VKTSTGGKFSYHLVWMFFYVSVLEVICSLMTVFIVFVYFSVWWIIWIIWG